MNEKTQSPEEYSENDFSAMLDEFYAEHNALERGDIINDAEIVSINENEILVALPSSKHDGIVPSRDIERMSRKYYDSLRVGDIVSVYVLNPLDAEGNIIVSLNLGKQAEDWEAAAGLLASGEATEVEVTGQNPGGILVSFGKIEGFIPNSHFLEIPQGLTGRARETAVTALIGQKVGVKVIEINQARRRLVLSQREAQKEWRQGQKQRLIETLSVGDVISGVVTGIRDFGVFVDLGGADGLIHVSEIAWYRVPHPESVVSVGQKIDVYVLELDKEKQRIALSRKRTMPDPWLAVEDRYHVDDVVTGEVLNVVDYGAFVVLEGGIEGLLHVSEMADGSLTEPHSYVSRGDSVTMKVVSINAAEKHIAFTQKGLALPLAHDYTGKLAAASDDHEMTIPLPDEDDGES